MRRFRLRLDPARVLRASQIRVGNIKVRGVPAILFGVTTIVLAAGGMRALRAAAPTLPEAIREATKLIDALRERDQRRLNA